MIESEREREIGGFSFSLLIFSVHSAVISQFIHKTQHFMGYLSDIHRYCRLALKQSRAIKIKLTHTRARARAYNRDSVNVHSIYNINGGRSSRLSLEYLVCNYFISSFHIFHLLWYCLFYCHGTMQKWRHFSLYIFLLMNVMILCRFLFEIAINEMSYDPSV